MLVVGKYGLDFYHEMRENPRGKSETSGVRTSLVLQKILK
jgi:hypothetical protein